MYVLCSSSSESGDVSVELHAHPDPFLPPVHAGQHGGTKFVMESPCLREALDRTFDKCKVLFSSSSRLVKRLVKIEAIEFIINSTY